MKTIGMLLIGFAAIDFIASYSGTNLNSVSWRSFKVFTDYIWSYWSSLDEGLITNKTREKNY